MNALPAGTTVCPRDKSPLLFRTLAGIRTFERVGKRLVYRARCEKCGRHYDVTKPAQGEGEK